MSHGANLAFILIWCSMGVHSRRCNLSDLKIKSAKTGMLANAAVIQVVVDALKKEASRIPLVIG